MTSKIAKAAMAGAHTAGIFADMTVDGPVIGDLVVHIDRAKNLPNRKTMGKQNPYCAARLGKDAQKTPTDKRGGQTPKWDHEMRFTVHDSPDYYKLKVSVFNDDKKTDLIGETWLTLDSILSRGGGEKEGWNNLNFKGRYAGEIWIELTYWDTRPREEKAAPQAAPQASPQSERTGEGLSGPRQLQAKAVKRRPLPADPTSSSSSPARLTLSDHSHSSPLPNHPTRGPGRLHGPASHDMNEPRQQIQPPPVPPEEYESLPKSLSQSHPGTYEAPPERLPDELHFEPVQPKFDNRPKQPHTSHEYDPRNSFSYGGEYTVEPEPVQDAYSEPQYTELDLPELPPHTPRNQVPPPNSSPRQYSHYEQNSSPAYTLPNYGPSPEAAPYHGQDTNHSGHGDRFEYEHGRQPSLDEYGRHAAYPSVEEDGPPPPPPVHRSSGLGSTPRDSPMGHQSRVSANSRPMRNSVSASPLAQHLSNLSEEDDFFYSPTETQLSTRSAPNIPYEQHEQPRRHSDRGLEMDAPHHEHWAQQHHDYHNHDHEPDHMLSRQENHSNAAGTAYSTPPHRGRHPSEHRYSVPPENDEYWDAGSTAPIIKPRAISPNAQQSSVSRRPVRKSVSPHPQPSILETPPSVSTSVPFSPDSFDQFNPNVKNATSINTPGPRYDTPEGARNAAREREKEEELAKGPIIDHKGNIVDPSDHLPADTWAPEPEPKPRKTHQINIKFKHATGPRMPPAPRETPPREPASRAYMQSSSANASPQQPLPLPAPMQMQHAYSESDASPASTVSSSGGGRNRLQKKSHARTHPPAHQPDRYHSSPLVPTTAHNSPAHMQSSPGYGHPQGYSPSPLREREQPNYGYSSPAYQGSPSPHGQVVRHGGPPPVPAKIPLSAGQEDWGRDQLSEEIGKIDLGAYGGGRRAARGRGGRGVRDI